MLQTKRTAVALLFVGLLAWGGGPSRVAAQAPTIAPPAAEPGRAAADPRRVAIRFLTDSDYPPFNYYDEDNVLTGFNVDIARAICLELAAACDIQVRPWPELLPALQAGRGRRGHRLACDQRRRAEGGRLHRPLLSHAGPLCRQAQLRPPRRHARGARGQEDRGHQGHRARGLSAHLLPRQLDPRLRDAELARDALISGAADLLFDDGISLAFWLNGTASKACCEFKGGPFGEPKYFGDGVAIAVNREDPQLKVLINAALKRMRESGRYEELVLRYFPLRAF